jgi:hypothetical protein
MTPQILNWLGTDMDKRDACLLDFLTRREFWRSVLSLPQAIITYCDMGWNEYLQIFLFARNPAISIAALLP